MLNREKDGCVAEKGKRGGRKGARSAQVVVGIRKREENRGKQKGLIGTGRKWIR